MSKIARVKFIRDKEPNIKALTAENKVLDGALYVATDTGTLWMGISSSSLIQIKDNINTNTTYNLTKSGSTITLRGSDGSTFNVTDSNTVYGNATASAAGLMSAADKAKLDGVAAGSNHVTVDAELSTTSTNPVQNKVIKSALDGKSNTGHTHDDRYYTESEINTKLNAKANSSHTHTKTQITDFPTSMPASDVYAWAKAASKPSYTIGEVSGNLAASRISGTISAANLPSYVDDVLEYASLSKFPTAGESGKIYTALDTNKIYRWSGSAYVVISETVALGTTHSSAGYGDESRAAYNHSTKTSGNPHHVTKTDVGLGNVDNTADSAKSVKYAASAGSASSATTAATANALKVTELSTQNLDDTKTVGLYFAGGANSVKNKPTGIDAFGLEVKRTAVGYLVQVLTDSTANPMKTWIRQFNARAWSAWAYYFDSNHTPTWSQVSGKPSFATVATSGSYNDLSNKPTIPTIPGSLKNPNALTISLNGTSQGAYDGSAVKNINITASSIGAAASSHTHTKAQITDFPTSMPASDVYAWAKAASKPSYTIGEVSGNLAASRISGTISAANLPSYVDDVLEYASLSKFPTAGESGKIYTALDTNKIYRWSGSAYVVISETVALGTTHSSAGYGDESRAAYNHSTKTSGNPHHVTKTDVGLGNVDNTADSAKSVKYAASAGSASSATTAATANALKVTELSTQNLDDTKTVGLYFAGGANSVKNKPTGIDAFGLEVKRTAVGYLVQVLTDSTANPMKTWIRQFNARAWSAWAYYFDSNHTPTWSQVSGKPSFATVATSGSYNDLSNKPTIPTIPGSLKNPNALTISLNGTSQGAYDGSAVKNINITASSIGAAASSHTHTKAQITDFPTSMPASDVYAWAKASSKPSYSWSEISGRPSIPSVGNGTVTITQNGATKGSFTLNQSGNATIALTDNNTVYSLPAATSSTLGGVKVGSNITNSSGTISLTKANVTSALGYTPPTSDTNTWRPEEVIISSTQPSASTCKLWIKI